MIDNDRRDGLNVALNECTLRSVQIDAERKTATVWVSALTLTEPGQAPNDTMFALKLSGVSRVAASLREGRWDDSSAAVTPVQLDALDSVVRDFGGTPIYGWEFIDPPEPSSTHWRDRLSLDATFSEPPAAHVIDLFQEESMTDRHLALRIWFNDLDEIGNRAGGATSVEEFIAGGVRWWDAMYAGDTSTQGHGIYPEKPDGPAPPAAENWLARTWRKFIAGGRVGNPRSLPRRVPEQTAAPASRTRISAAPPTERWPLYSLVEFLPNNLGVRAGSVGCILEDYGRAYEVEISSDDGTTAWIGGVEDQYLRLRDSPDS